MDEDIACINGSVWLVELLLSMGEGRTTILDEFTPLHVAAAGGHNSIVQIFVQFEQGREALGKRNLLRT